MGRVARTSEGIVLIVQSPADQAPLKTWLAKAAAPMRKAAQSGVSGASGLARLAGLLKGAHVRVEGEDSESSESSESSGSSGSSEAAASVEFFDEDESVRSTLDDHSALHEAMEEMQMKLFARAARERSQHRQNCEQVLKDLESGGDTRETFLKIAQQRGGSSTALETGDTFSSDNTLLMVQGLIMEHQQLMARVQGLMSSGATSGAEGLLKKGQEKLDTIVSVLGV